MLRRLAQQRMTLNDLEWPFDASRAISVQYLSFFLFHIVVTRALYFAFATAGTCINESLAESHTSAKSN